VDLELDFKAIPGEIFFDREELERATRTPPGFILIEPNVPWHKTVAPNKDWGRANYQKVADELRSQGHVVAQFSYGEIDCRAFVLSKWTRSVRL
jgi:hypothetical protein